MKKYFFFALTAAMMSFAGCQKNEMEDPNAANGEGSTFELVADVVQTKTTLDASTYKVAWEEGDVIYVVTEDEEWGAAYENNNTNLNTIAEFVYGDGKFTTEASISAGDHIFNAMYTRADQKTWHRGAGSSHSLLATQSQDCTNPTAHIKLNDALAGTFTVDVSQTSTAQVDMHHLYTLMQVNVKNNTDNPVEVTKFEMTAEGADLAGIFNVTSFKTPSITAKEGEAATETITVNVTGGAVAAGASLPVYFVMAPLSDYTGDVTFKVTAADGKTYTKTTAVSDLDFNAGAYNTTPYTISEREPENPEETVTDVLTRAMIGVTSQSYSTWSGKTATSSAVYAGNSAGGNESIQLRSNNNNSGIVTTRSAGVVKKIIVTWNSSTDPARKLDVYGKSTAYTQATDLYSSTNQGTKIGTLAYGTSELVIDNEYQFIGLRSQSGAMYLTEIKVVWETTGEGGDTTTPQPRNLAFTSETENATVGQPFTEPTLNGVTTDVEYSSSNTAVATVNVETGAVTLVAAGTTTIKASAPATTEYEYDEASYTLTVSAAVVDDTDYSGQYIIVAEKSNKYYYMSTLKEGSLSGNNRSAIDSGVSEISDYESSRTDFPEVDESCVWNVTKVDAGYKFENLDRTAYLYTVDENRAQMGPTTNENASSIFNISVDDHIYTVSDTKYERTLSLNTNTGSDLFACYESGQNRSLVFIPYVPDTTPKIKVTSALEQTIGSEGGELTFNYELKNLEGKTLTATPSVDYLAASVSSNVVTVTVQANETTEERTATITFACEGAESKTVTVKQAAAEQGGGDESQEATWHNESWSNCKAALNSYGTATFEGDLGTWKYTGCSSFDAAQFETKMSLALGQTSDNSSITSPTFVDGIKGIKFNYFANNTARKVVVRVYENGTKVKEETITPAAKNARGSAEIIIETSGSTYFTFTPGSTSRRVSVGDIQVKY